MGLYKHLLLPTDLSEGSVPPAERVKGLLALSDAKLTVLHVVDYVPPRWVANELPEGLGTEKALVDRARTQLDDWIDKTGLEGHDKVIAAGPAKRVIVDTARERGVDLIVMGTHGDRGVARILGSTARGVLHDTPCDVLVVHLG